MKVYTDLDCTFRSDRPITPTVPKAAICLLIDLRNRFPFPALILQLERAGSLQACLGVAVVHAGRICCYYLYAGQRRYLQASVITWCGISDLSLDASGSLSSTGRPRCEPTVRGRSRFGQKELQHIVFSQLAGRIVQQIIFLHGWVHKR